MPRLCLKPYKQDLVRNKADLDTMSIDDLYNNFKIVEQEVKRTVTTSSSLRSSNMAFLSSPGSTNEVYNANIQVSTVSTPVSTVNLKQIHEDDLEEMDLKWQLALLSMRARRYFQRTGKKITINGSDTVGYNKRKVECFNCHKMEHFLRECRSPRNQESRPKNQDNSRKTVNVKDTSSKAMVTIDGAGFNWSYMADDEAPTNMDIMDFSDLEIGLGFASYNVVAPPPTGLFSPLTIDLSNSGLEEFQHPEFKGYGPKTILTKSGIVPINTARQSSLRASAPVSVARPINTAAPKPLVNVIKPRQNALQKSHSLFRRPFYQQTTLNNRNLNNKINTAKVNSVNTAKGNRVTSAVGKQGINVVKSSACWHDGGYVAFGGGAKGGKIIGKVTIKTSKLNFEDVYFVKELQFNIFSVSQMCDKKNNVLFTDTEYFVLSPNFKLADESHVLLKVPRKNNMYSFDMKNIVPQKDLTYLLAKATNNESML
nr:ribonuclease H-like domain-containing protein [Tanacetum cinerariifolium]